MIKAESRGYAPWRAALAPATATAQAEKRARGAGGAVRSSMNSLPMKYTFKNGTMIATATVTRRLRFAAEWPVTSHHVKHVASTKPTQITMVRALAGPGGLTRYHR